MTIKRGIPNGLQPSWLSCSEIWWIISSVRNLLVWSASLHTVGRWDSAQHSVWVVLADTQHSAGRTQPAEGGHRILSHRCPENNILHPAVDPTPVQTHDITKDKYTHSWFCEFWFIHIRNMKIIIKLIIRLHVC